jgi:hypothetical protein
MWIGELDARAMANARCRQFYRQSRVMASIELRIRRPHVATMSAAALAAKVGRLSLTLFQSIDQFGHAHV